MRTKTTIAANAKRRRRTKIIAQNCSCLPKAKFFEKQNRPTFNLFTFARGGSLEFEQPVQIHFFVFGVDRRQCLTCEAPFASLELAHQRRLCARSPAQYSGHKFGHKHITSSDNRRRRCCCINKLASRARARDTRRECV